MSIIWLLIIILIFIALFGGFAVNPWIFLLLILVVVLAVFGAI